MTDHLPFQYAPATGSYVEQQTTNSQRQATEMDSERQRRGCLLPTLALYEDTKKLGQISLLQMVWDRCTNEGVYPSTLRRGRWRWETIFKMEPKNSLSRVYNREDEESMR